jgi:hypothetical protein
MLAKRFFAVLFALVVVLTLGATRLKAQNQTTGDIVGTVTDPSNSVVPDAKVTLKDNTKGNTQDAKTNKEGNFRFYLLAPGPYTVTVAAGGFEAEVRQAQVAVGQIATVDFHLTLGASTQTVMVTEVAPLVQTENGDTATAVSEQQVSNVPNPGNDLSAIAQIAPGVVMNTQGGYGNVEAFGLPATSNLFTLNGMDDNDPFLNLNNSGATNLLLGSNEIQEADVVTNGYSGTFGTFSGIQVNYITKSGGNQFHGNAVYYWNGSALNANDFLSNASGSPRPFDNANQWAASIGGPIKKDKLFFFFNTEGLRVLIPVQAAPVIVPTTAFEAATVTNLTTLGETASIPFYCQNLSGICSGVSGVAGAGNGIFNIFNSMKGYSTGINNLTAGGCDNVDTTAAPFLGFGPTNPCMLSVKVTPINFAPEKQYAGRVDWNIGNNDRAYMRVQYDQGVQPTFTDPLNSLFNAASNQPEYQGQLQETHTFGATMSNQFLLAATWYSAIFGPANNNATLAAFPTSFISGDDSFGSSGFCGQGISASQCVWPQGRNVTQFQIGDDVSKSVGNHTVKFGVKYHRNYVSDHDFGTFTSGLEVPITLADFVNGGAPGSDGSIGTELIQSFPFSQNSPVRLYELGGYLQDEWRIKSNFTFTAALRVEHASNPICVTLCFAQLSEPLQSLNASTALPYNEIIHSDRRSALTSYQNLQWAPRIGFAWQPFGSATGWAKSDFVIRGGIGYFYDIFPGQIADSMAENPPLDPQFTVASASIGGSCAGYLSPTQAGNLFQCASAANSAFQTAFSSGASTLPSGVPAIVDSHPNTSAPQVQKWSLEIQKGFGRNDSIDIGYYGNHSIHQPILVKSANAFGLGGGTPDEPYTEQFGEVTQLESIGISNYNGLIASYKHRFTGWGNGVFQYNYTYSHGFDLVSNGGFNAFTGSSQLDLANPANSSVNYGPSDYDVRHNMNANYVWELPIRRALGGHGWKPLVDGWQVSGTVFFRTGLPFGVTDTDETDTLEASNNFYGPTFPSPLGAIPTNTCNSLNFVGPASVNTTSCLAPDGTFAGAQGAWPQPGTETSLSQKGLRNLFRGPHYFDTDFSFTKKTKIPGWERGEFDLGLQFFNFFNHPNFSLPDSDLADLNSGFFGTIQATVAPPTSILGSFLGGDASPRLIQVKAQFVF